jgi:ABC-type Fe3+-siderophore transport system permease subunit
MFLPVLFSKVSLGCVVFLGLIIPDLGILFMGDDRADLFFFFSLYCYPILIILLVLPHIYNLFRGRLVAGGPVLPNSAMEGAGRCSA